MGSKSKILDLNISSDIDISVEDLFIEILDIFRLFLILFHALACILKSKNTYREVLY